MAGVLPNVLLVDDSPQDLEIMSLYLREMAVVHTAANGSEALEYVKRNKIDVILLDIEMPFMDGFEAVERCKAQGAKKTVLLIDDDMSYLKQVNSILQDKYNVIMINSAKLALEYLLKHIPDVIILYYQMPLYNGTNMMRLIKNSISEKEKNADIPVIILSGALDREVLQECYTYNPVACLAKPVSKEVLEQNIEQALNR